MPLPLTRKPISSIVLDSYDRQTHIFPRHRHDDVMFNIVQSKPVNVSYSFFRDYRSHVDI